MKVAVIGAGLAGLTAARELKKHDVNVQVFEKSRGIGGRLSTKRLDWAQIDIGAQYFTVRDARFHQQVQEWKEQGVVDIWDFTPYRLKGSQLLKSPDDTLRYVGTPKMNAMAHALAKDIDITFSTRITSLNHNSRGWQLNAETDSHSQRVESYFDAVVVAIPAEQSSLLLEQTALSEQLPLSVHEPCWALAVSTLGKVPQAIQGIFGDFSVSWVSRLSSKPHRIPPNQADDLWMLHFSSEWSETNDKQTCIDIKQFGLDWLSKALEAYIDKPLKSINHYEHYWRYARFKENHQDSFLLADPDSKIIAIGDWSQGGRVEGAYLSALNVVQSLL